MNKSILKISIFLLAALGTVTVTHAKDTGITMTKDGKTAYVAMGRANRVAVVDVTSRKVNDYILVGERAWNTELNKDESLLFVVNGLSDDVSIIDTKKGKVIKSVPVGRNRSLKINDIYLSKIMYSKSKSLLFTLLVFFAFFSSPTSYAETKENKVFTIGYLELKSDKRYKKKQVFARFMGQALGRPFAGAKVALKEIKFHGTELGISFDVQRAVVKKPEELEEKIAEMRKDGIQFFILDLPAEQVAELAKTQRDKDIVLFNASAYQTALRLPSHAMLADALGQYLISKKWRNILVLQGSLPEDKLLTEAFAAAA
ncbi:hypothetical protein GQR58_003268 [Nymphon striatum]|nr:hypothetical protein GQR58_003268 [Nymphon striatum]